MSEKLKILVVDDEENARVMLKQMTSYMGHEAILASNGMEAVKLFASEEPDIVLMDVMMPELDGYKATEKIRQMHPEKWVPIVFLSALERDANLLKGLDVGGDDYIAKPVNLSELQAKIRAMQRVAVLQGNLAAERRLLEVYYQQAEEETRIGSHIMERLTSTASLKGESIQHWSRPLRRFSGDLMAAARTPGNVLHVMLADAVGHGLPAALNVLPLADTFYGMTQRGFPLGRIIEEMDRKIKQLLPVDRFVTATLLSIDEYNKEIQVWNGGNPAPLFISESGEVKKLEGGKQLPLGLLGNAAKECQPQAMIYQEKGQVILFTDGLCEAQARDGTFMDCAGIAAVLPTLAPDERLDFILDKFEIHLDGEPIQDDVSLMLVDLSYEDSKPAPVQQDDGHAVRETSNAAGWKAGFRLGAKELKKLDAIPFLTSVVEKLEASSEHRRQIFMILSELFNNALEHGILQLDSNMKSTHEGFDAYMHERSNRLNTLEQGHIEINLESLNLDGKPVLKIHLKDSGNGFNYRELEQNDSATHTRTHGRGIHLVKRFSQGLQYFGTGNEVKTYYFL